MNTSTPTTLQLFTCPRCGRTGFYSRGLLAHVCRGTHFLDPRRRLTPAELAAARLYACVSRRFWPPCSAEALACLPGRRRQAKEDAS